MGDEKLDSIIRKVKGLMALAEDNTNEDEAQSAFVLAQKLIMKYNIAQSNIDDTGNVSSIIQAQATAFKMVYWHEKLLASIIGDNFRVKYFYDVKRLQGEKRKKSTLMFYGLEHDVKIAKEMFILANDAIDFYTKRFVKSVYSTGDFERNKAFTSKLKNSYMQGFINGLSDKLNAQRTTLQEDFGLILLTPKIVEDEFKDFSSEFTKVASWSIPEIEEAAAFHKGYIDGEEIDYTKTTVKDDGSFKI